MGEDKYTVQDLQDNLNYIGETKRLIKQAIINKGQEVSDTDTFRSYKDKIDAISTGAMSEEDYERAIIVSQQILSGEVIDGSMIS